MSRSAKSGLIPRLFAAVRPDPAHDLSAEALAFVEEMLGQARLSTIEHQVLVASLRAAGLGLFGTDDVLAFVDEMLEQTRISSIEHRVLRAAVRNGEVA